MEKIKVSVIVPVYNQEKFLGQCLDTIINQTLKEIEIICVDDGSTDHSLEILNQYAKQDSRIRIIQQHNQYAGVARNNGLKIAQGEYVIFLDSDDFFKEDMLEKIYFQGTRVNADIVLFSAKKFNTITGEYIEQSHYFHKNYAPTEVFSRHDIPERIFTITTPCPWTKLFRRKFIIENNIKFQNLQSSNDVYFVFVALAMANKITYVDEAFVYYRIGQSENLQTKKSNTPTLFLKAYEAVYDRLISEGIFAEIEKSFVITTVSGCIYNLDSVNNEYARIEIYREICSSRFKRMGILDHPLNYYSDSNKIQRLQGAEYIVKWYDKLNDKKQINSRVVLDLRPQNFIPVVSIIVPVYNVAPYLKQCLDSLKKQTLHSIEIICVNDGSTDNSFEILYSYAQADNRFVICSQENAGQSAARNIGVRQARGQYLYFMDGDDILNLKALELVYNFAKQMKADVVYFDGFCFTDYGAYRKKCENQYYIRKHGYEGIWDGKDLLTKMVENEEYRVSPCLQLINKDYFFNNKLHFYEGILHEDNLFNFQCILNAKNACYIPKQLFYRRYRAGSTMTMQTSFAHVYGYFRCYLEIYDFYERLNLDENTEKAILNLMSRILWSARNDFDKLSEPEKYSIYGLSLRDRMLFQLFISNICDLKSKIEWLRKGKNSLNDKLNNIYAKEKRLEEQIRKLEQQIKKADSEKKMLKERLDGLENSETFMVGKIMVYLPRKIKQLLKTIFLN